MFGLHELRQTLEVGVSSSVYIDSRENYAILSRKCFENYKQGTE